MNKYDNETTDYQNPDESTQFDNSIEEQKEYTRSDNFKDSEEGTGNTNRSTWKRAAAGAGSGLLIGSVSTLLMSMDNAPVNDESGKDDAHHKEEFSHPEWVDDEVTVATSVNDDMSFGEAFGAARAEVGPGGCFEWHGNLYGTYTAEEWSNMTAEQRAEWSDHFSWNHIDHSESSVAQHSSTARHSSSHPSSHASVSDDDIEVVSVNHANDVAQNNSPDSIGNNAEEVVASPAEPDIEIIGVVHNNEQNVNFGAMTIDGQDVILIDVDNDLTFDYMATDANRDGKVDDNEIVNIQGQNLTVNDLGGFSNHSGDLYAGNDGPDYTNDAIYEG